MTELQILRTSLFDEITRLKRKTTTPNESLAIVKVANAIVSTYNTELKAISVIAHAGTQMFNVPELKIFTEDTKNALEFKANDVED